MAARPGSASQRPRAATPAALGDTTIGTEARAGGDDGFRSGAVIGGRYRILELLGRGGMGAVYRARDLTLGADVAIKMLAPGLADDPARVAHFRNEVILARRVTHANVCRLHDIIEEGDGWFLTMEYVEGETLAERLQRDPSGIDLAFALAVIRDVAAGLTAAHKVGVVHRDLKPGNILLGAETGRAVIADFGIAVEVNQLGSARVDRAGTRGYMSPEQAAGGEIDARTDVFALGVLAFRMLAGELPPVAPTTVAHTEETEAPAAIPEAIPPALAALIARCLRRDPADRFADASEVLEALAAVADRPTRSRRPVLRLAALALALAVAVAAVAVAVAARGGPLRFAPPRQIVITSIDAAGVEGARGDWIEAALGRRLVNELDDAWGMTARLEGDPGPAISSLDLGAAIAVRSDLRGLAATLILDHRGRLEREVSGATLQELAEAAAAAIARTSVPPGLHRPTAIELARTGGAVPAAWRLFRRSQRASSLQLWPLARILSRRALELDPDFVAGNLEYGYTFATGDDARLAPLRRAIAGASGELSESWRLAVELAEASLSVDPAAQARAVEALLAANLDFRDRWYVLHRLHYGQWYDGAREDSLAHLEALEARYLRSAGAPKLLANHYLARDDPEARRLALDHARNAVARGADDVASRADLARALLGMGDRAAALEQVSLIEGADEEDKRWAVAGGEETNSLFDLYMALGDFARADRAARRRETGPTAEQGQAHLGRAFLLIYRGDVEGGLERIRRAIAAFDQSGQKELVGTAHRRLAAVAHSLGDSDAVLEAVAGIPPEMVWPFHEVIAEIARHRKSGEARHLRRAAAIVEGLREPHSEKAFLGVLVAAERHDWERIRALENGAVRWRRHIAARYPLGLAREKGGDLEMAARHYERLAQHRYNWSEPIWAGKALLAAARVRAALGDVATARAHYQAFLDRHDRAPPSHEGVAIARRELARLAGR